MRRRRVPYRVVAVTALAAVAALAGLYGYLVAASARADLANARKENDNVARVVATRADAGGPLSQLDPFLDLLVEEDQWVDVVRGGDRWSGGADLPAGTRTTSSAVPLRDGYVRVVSTVDRSVDSPAAVVLVALTGLVVVLGTLAVSTTLANRGVRRRVDVAVAAAERIAAGDLASRIAAEGADDLGRLGQAFDAMAEQLENVDADQRRLLADLTHEIATPVHALAGFARAILDGTVPVGTAREVIDSSTSRLSRLLDDLATLRDVDRPAPGPPAPVDVGALCRRSVAEHLAAAAAADVDLRVTEPVTACVVHTREDPVTIARGNLVSNAVRYTGPGGHVVVAVAGTADHVTVAVTDDGPGIPPDQLGRVFDRFHRVDPARSRDTGGSGLGLAIARRAAVSAGAALTVTSGPGRGSIFLLALPLDPQDASGIVPASTSAATVAATRDGVSRPPPGSPT